MNGAQAVMEEEAPTYPDWWDPRGNMIRLVGETRIPREVRLEGETVGARITRRDGHYEVAWEIIEDGYTISCSKLFSEEILGYAFGVYNVGPYLKPIVRDASRKLIALHGVDAAVEGKFLRKEEFLSIPGRCSDEVDATLGILLSEEIREAIRRLLS